MTSKKDDRPGKGDLSNAGIVAIGAVAVVALLPIVLGTVGHPVNALILAAVLLAFTVLVRPEGSAAPLRWVPAGFGLFMLVAGVVGLLL